MDGTDAFTGPLRDRVVACLVRTAQRAHCSIIDLIALSGKPHKKTRRSLAGLII